jgi:hypothetical protein
MENYCCGHLLYGVLIMALVLFDGIVDTDILWTLEIILIELLVSLVVLFHFGDC